jgi:hypothetical protein
MENAMLDTRKTAASRQLSAREIVHRAGLPEAAMYFMQRMLQAETEVMLQGEDIRSLKARLSALENKV